MLEFNLKRNERLNLYFIGDLHIGHVNFNEDLFHKFLTTFKEDKNDKLLFLLGDLVDNGSTNIGWADNDKTVNECVDYLVEYLKPFNDYICISHFGNHEARISKNFKFDLGESIAKRLEVPYSRNDYFTTILINDKLFTIYTKHGNKFSKSKELFMKNTMNDLNNSIDAHLYAVGHAHYLDFKKKYFVFNNHDVRIKAYVSIGNFLKYWDSYAHDGGKDYMPCGFQIVSVDKDLDISNKYIYGDD